MIGSRGDPGPDPMVSLLGIVGDPAATADRIKQLQAAKEDSVKALEALQERQAELDKQASDQDDREDDLKEQQRALDQRAAELEQKAKAADSTAKSLSDRETSAQEQIAAELAKAKAQGEANAEVSRNLALKESELSDLQVTIDHRNAGLEDQANSLRVREELLVEREAELDKKMEALRELVG